MTRGQCLTDALDSFAVFTANRRDVVKLEMPTSSGKPIPVVFVAVGAYSRS
jgi:hypothetical protein